MNITEQIENSITEFSINSNGGISAQAVFAAEFSGFDGHFPQRPILPGICQIELCRILAQKSNNLPLIIKEVKLAKFFSPIVQNETIEISMTATSDLGWEVDIQCKGEKKTHIDLILKNK